MDNPSSLGSRWLIIVLHNYNTLFHAFRPDREISVKIFFHLTLVPLPIFMFLLPWLIARASQPDGNMMSFTLHFSRLM